jgi:hypothetical protein
MTFCGSDACCLTWAGTSDHVSVHAATWRDPNNFGQDVYMARGKVHAQVAELLGAAINDAQTSRRSRCFPKNWLCGAPSGFRTSDPLIKG